MQQVRAHHEQLGPVAQDGAKALGQGEGVAPRGHLLEGVVRAAGEEAQDGVLGASGLLGPAQRAVCGAGNDIVVTESGKKLAKR